MSPHAGSNGWKTGLKISLAYAVFGLVWIFYSDHVLESMSSDPAFITQMQTYKGWAYVLVTAGLIFVLVRHYVVRLFRTLTQASEDLTQELAERERALQEASQSRFGQLIEGLSGKYFYYTHSTEGVFTYVSPSIEIILGYTQDEFLQHFTTFLPATPLNERAQKHTEGSIRGELQPVYEIDVLIKDGSTRRIEVFERPVLDGRGEVVGIEGMCCDITGRVAEAERFAGLLESAPDAMIVTDQSGEITLVNARTEAVFGYPRDELIGMKVEMLVPDHLRDGHPAQRDAYRSSPAVRQMSAGRGLMAQRKDGSTFPAEIGLSPLKTEVGMLVVAAVRDVTERIQVQEELREARNTAQQAAQEAEDANRAKSVFLANVSHEIRTPMNAILGFADILQQQVGDPGQKAHLSSIQTSGQSLIGLLTDILDLSRAQSGGLGLEEAPASTRKIFVDLNEAFETRAGQKSLAFEMDLDGDLPAGIVVDERKLRRVLDNLVDNAVKFTESGRVRVSARAAASQTTESTVDLRIDVEDTGQGIPADQIDLVFEAFTQKKGQSINEFGGTGLGLALTKALLTEMGGRIHVESQVGVGSTFRVCIDAIQVTESAAIAHLEPEPQVADLDGSGPEEPQWSPEGLSDEARSKLPELVGRLDELSGASKELAHTLTINDVEDFAARVVQLGEAYHLPPVADWGQRLADQAAMFDMDGLPKTLRDFPGLIQQVRYLLTA
jgi:PAS domain S-box-containing protein